MPAGRSIAESLRCVPHAIRLPAVHPSRCVPQTLALFTVRELSIEYVEWLADEGAR